MPNDLASEIVNQLNGELSQEQKADIVRIIRIQYTTLADCNLRVILHNYSADFDRRYTLSFMSTPIAKAEMDERLSFIDKADNYIPRAIACFDIIQ